MNDRRDESDMIGQACAIPFRWNGNTLEFCLITTSRGRWGFPKGIIDPGETLEETALKESHEEAGLRGRILDQPIGCFQYTKWDSLLAVTVVLMEVEDCEDDWQESDWRRRRWASYQTARELLGREELVELFETARHTIPDERPALR